MIFKLHAGNVASFFTIASARLEAPGGLCYKRGVFFRKKDKPRERFYLLPGQGGRNFHRKQRYIMRWTVSLALLFGAVLAVAMWWLAKPKP